MKLPGARSLVIAVSTLIGILLVVIAVLVFKLNTADDNPAAAAKAASDRVLRQVSQIYDVPTNEQPSVAQVEDKRQLQDQPFFARAKNGDYIIIYEQNKLAMVYREKDRKLINVGPVNFNGTAGTNAGTD